MARSTDPHLRDDPAGALMRYLDGDLAPRERARVEDHLTACARCAAEVRRYHDLFAAVRSLPARRPSRVLAGRILAAIEAERAAARPQRAWIGVLGASYAFGFALVLGAAFAIATRGDLAAAARGGLTTAMGEVFGVLLAAVDRIVGLMSAAVRFGETMRALVEPLAPVWRSVAVVTAQPDLRAGMTLALVLTALLWWFLAHRRLQEPGRFDHVAFLSLS